MQLKIWMILNNIFLKYNIYKTLTQFSKNGLRVRQSYEQLMNAIVDNDILNLNKVPKIFDSNWLMLALQMTQIRKDALLDFQNLPLQKDKQELLRIKANEIAREKASIQQLLERN